MIQKTFLKILKSSLNGETDVSLPPLSKEDWTEVFRLSENHRLLPLMYNCFYSSYPFDKSDLAPLKARTKALVLEQILKTQVFTKLYEKLCEQGLSPVVVKGIVCRSLYPQGDARISSDEDFLVSSDEFEIYSQALISLSLSPFKTQSESSYQTAFLSKDGLRIELHKALFPTNSDYFIPWNKTFENSRQSTVIINADNCLIKTLSPTDNLLYLLLHALKHFFHSGVGIRQVCDIIMFANRYGKEVDWERFFTLCKGLGAKKFALAVFAIGVKHLNFNRQDANFPSNINLDEVSELPLLEDILSGGIFGSTSMARQHSSGITFDAVQGKKASLIKRTFPSPKKLSGKYAYAKQNPLLLPVAWSHRLINYKKESAKLPDNRPSDTLQIGKRRLEILKLYGLIKE